MPADELIGHVVDFVQSSKEFLLIPGAPHRLILNDSEDPFINWMVKSVKRESTAA
jgi:hypothetical protein